MSVDAVRDAAVEVLLRVFERHMFLSDSLDKTLRRKAMSDRGSRFLTQLVYGTVRHMRLADHILNRLLQQPITELPMPIHIILRMGVFQSLFLSGVTFPAMVHTSVDLAKKRGHPGTARLVNAVLNKAPQKIEDVPLPDPETNLPRHLGVRYSLPDWMVREWIQEFGEEVARELCVACSEQAPTAIRTNTLKISTEQLIERLQHADVLAQKVTPIPEELTIVNGSALRSKLFQQGFFILQDPASMLAAHLVEPKAGEWVLDLCAAPGGKTTHMAQLMGGAGTILASDLLPWRVGQVLENTTRLGIGNVKVLCADAAKPCYTRKFDAILLDAPCSGLGTLRRHPDLKWRANPEDSARLAQTQRGLLRAAAQLCENGGRIVYAVCTMTREETLGIRSFAESLEGFHFEDGPAWLNEWKISPGTYRTLPVKSGSMDGFFLMRLRKSS